MKLLVIVGPDATTAALREARTLGRDVSLPADLLNAPLDDEATSWFNRVWDKVEGAILRASREGLDAARPLIEQADALFHEMSTSIARRVNDVRTAISAKLDRYVHAAIDYALRRVSATLVVGGREMRLTGVTVEQRVSLSGSIHVSIEEVCEFAAEGEFSLAAEYTFAA